MRRGREQRRAAGKQRRGSAVAFGIRNPSSMDRFLRHISELFVKIVIYYRQSNAVQYRMVQSGSAVDWYKETELYGTLTCVISRARCRNSWIIKFYRLMQYRNSCKGGSAVDLVNGTRALWNANRRHISELQKSWSCASEMGAVWR